MDQFSFTRYLSIKPNAYKLSELDVEQYLARYEIGQISTAPFWVVLNDFKPKNLSPAEIMNTLLMAFWIHVPSRIDLKYRFGDGGDFARVLSRFEFNKFDQNKEFFSLTDLEKVNEYYRCLIRIKRNGARLFAALSNTFMGCLQYNWKASYLLFAAALEAMLTYSSAPGITNRLSKAFACLMSSKKTDRDRHYRRFYRSYQIRSDLMHGRMRKKRNLLET